VHLLGEEDTVQRISRSMFLALALITLVGVQGYGTGSLAQGDSNQRYVDTRDGHVYRTVSIGRLVWFAENLAYMPHVSPGAAAGGIWLYGYEGSDTAEAKTRAEYAAYGNLYDWDTAMSSCPAGWHLPSDEEWKSAELALGMTSDETSGMGWRGSDQGTRMKQGGDSRFDAVLAGWRSGSGTLGFRGEHANFWTATPLDQRAYERLLNVRRPTVGRDLGNKSCGFSVRCVRRP
jgi:uncharacterized protein (TIGR02145 family)